MESIHKYRFNTLEFDIDKLKLIGEGLEGRAYLLPDGKVLKVFYLENSYRSQLETLKKAQDSRFFPTIYGYGNNSITMSFIPGIALSEYLKQNKIDKHLSIELVNLVEEFKRLQFKRLDIRLAHIYVQPDKNIKIIDPRESYERFQPFPRKLLKGLKERRALKDFYNIIKLEYPELYKQWSRKVS